MDDRAVEMIGKQRTARAALCPVGAEHEVVDDQLAFAAEQVGQGPLAVGTVEHIIFLDLLPRKFAAFAAQGVTGAGELFFVRKMRLARREPLVMGNDLVRFHVTLLSVFPSPPWVIRSLSRSHPANPGAA